METSFLFNSQYQTNKLTQKKLSYPAYDWQQLIYDILH